MSKAILLRVDGSTEFIQIPGSLDDNYEEMVAIIGSEDSYLTGLISDVETERTIFLLTDVYNDFQDDKYIQPPLNSFIANHSKAKIYGDVLVYLSEPPEDSVGDDITYDLELSIDDLKVLMESVEINKRNIFSPFVLYEILRDPIQRGRLTQILRKVGISKFTDDSEEEPIFDLPRH